jgi:RNA polymerase sigma-70 factor (ECF subfamily)
LDEADLIHRAQQGDQPAWIRLVEAHQEGVFHLAYLFLGDPDEAEDVAQETFIRAFRSLERFECNRSLRPWLLRIVSNLSRNQLRSSGRYWSALIRFGRREIRAANYSLEELSLEKESSMAIWEAVKRLRQEDQEVIYLRYFLDLSVEDTAQALKIAEGTVKSRLHRSLKRLEKVITKDFPTLIEEHTV